MKYIKFTIAIRENGNVKYDTFKRKIVLLSDEKIIKLIFR